MKATRRSRPALGLAAGTVTLLLATAAFAQFGPGPGPMAGPGAGRGPGGGIVRALRAGLATLDLTEEQQTKIKGIFETKKGGFEELRTRMRADAHALHEAANATSPDPAAVGAAFLKLKVDRVDAKEAFDALMADVKSVLTPEQRTKLEGYLAALRHMRRRA